MTLRAKYVAGVLTLAIAARLLLFVFVQPWIPQVEEQIMLQNDALGYHQLATTLLQEHRFAYDSTTPPEALRTPLYPMFIAGIYWLFGNTPWVVLLIQILLDTLSCWLLIAALARLFDGRVALIAALFYALDPFLIAYSSSLLSDVPFVFLLVAAFYTFSRAVSEESHIIALLEFGMLSALLGLATLVRPISQYIPLVLVTFLLVWNRRQLRIAAERSLVCVFFFALVLSPWLIRNYSTFGRLSLSTSGQYNLLALNVLPMEMARRHEDAGMVRASLLSETEGMAVAEGLQPQELNEFQMAEYWQRLAIRYVANDPVRFGQSYLLGVFHTFANVGTSTLAGMLGLPNPSFDIKAYTSIPDLLKAFIREKDSSSLLIAGLVIPYLIVSYLAMATGLVVSWKQYNKVYLLLCLALAIYFIAITGAAGLARFKLPSIPFYLPFVGIGTAHFLHQSLTRFSAKGKL